MRKIILNTVILLLLISCVSNKDTSEANIDSSLLGKKNKQEWLRQTNTINQYSSYQPDQDDLLTFNDLIREKHYTFVLFAGLDCQDCHDNIPKILKIYDMAGIKESEYSIYVLDNKLEEPSGFYKIFDIPTTPSLFILDKDKEVGLIAYPYYNWLEMMIELIRDDLK